MSEPDYLAERFEEHRTHLRAVAYRMLGSLAEVLASMLQAASLRQERLRQEQLARELALEASRSELKALRAQIRPHFLFNALNAIAGLIHKDPLRADRTIERLAEVFRYTLRGSEREWAVLEHELEFARSYLEVEQARFGRRLAFRIDVGEGAGALHVPTMMVQTLVENYLANTSIDPADCTITIQSGSGGSIDTMNSHDPLFVQITVPYNSVSFGLGSWLGGTTLGATVEMRRE